LILLLIKGCQRTCKIKIYHRRIQASSRKERELLPSLSLLRSLQESAKMSERHRDRSRNFDRHGRDRSRERSVRSSDPWTPSSPPLMLKTYSKKKKYKSLACPQKAHARISIRCFMMYLGSKHATSKSHKKSCMARPVLRAHIQKKKKPCYAHALMIC
jgi:hypothetical protein